MVFFDYVVMNRRDEIEVAVDDIDAIIRRKNPVLTPRDKPINSV